MIAASPTAERQLDALRTYYEDKGRPEAITSLASALRQASIRIERSPDDGLAAPRPYPEMVHAGRKWIKEGGYWIAYSATTPPVILGMFYDQADLPRRAPSIA